MTLQAPIRAADEAERARIIASYDVMAARDAGELDDLAAFAAELCGTPVGLVTIVEEAEQHFLAKVGTDLSGSPRDISFCTHALNGPQLTVVPDALLDPRFATNPLVLGGPMVRFYAGIPLVSGEGVALGTVCVLDTVPRDGLSAFQEKGLAILARATMGRLEDRRATLAAGIVQAEQHRRLEDSERRFRTLADTMPQMVWSTLPDGFHDYYNARWYEFTGAPEGTTDGEGWSGMFHADDQARAWTQWRHSLETGDPYQIEYRLRHFDGTYRWVLGRALPIRSADGAIVRWFGTCTDIHAQKLALEEREVVSQELSHRIKNIFAVISGLIAFAARSRPDFRDLATDLRERITALGRAHDFVRPHSARSMPAVRQDSLTSLLGDLFAPYQSAAGTRIVVKGDDVAIDDRSTTPLALLFHELATNATKYGALSVGTGHVAVDIARDDDAVLLRWTETGGPPVTAPQGSGGFGSQLVEMSAVRQLGGTVDRDWRRDGLAVRIAIPEAAFSRA